MIYIYIERERERERQKPGLIFMEPVGPVSVTAIINCLSIISGSYAYPVSVEDKIPLTSYLVRESAKLHFLFIFPPLFELHQ